VSSWKIKCDEKGTVSFKNTGQNTISPSILISLLQGPASRKKSRIFEGIPEFSQVYGYSLRYTFPVYV
jgi:hypothetical protein